MALGKPRDGEGKLGSETVEGSVGKLLMCSLEGQERENNNYKIDINRICTAGSITTILNACKDILLNSYVLA